MAFDTFVVFTGEPKVEGETADSVYSAKKAFEIFSFSFGCSNPTTISSAAGGLTGGKVSWSSFNIMKKSDKASPILMKACCLGAHYSKVEVFLRKAVGTGGQKVYLTYTFEEVLVESVQWSGSSGGDDTPTESVSLAFGKVTYDYKPQVDAGTLGDSVIADWDLRKIEKTK